MRQRLDALCGYMLYIRVRLLLCSFYSNGQFQGLYKRNGQTCKVLALFILSLTM